ncbi:MAG: hypothetical protein KDK70_37535, partial [Myxococcales bacterium]|nr:hypothetical protein [Myxococcales bacterium]
AGLDALWAAVQADVARERGAAAWLRSRPTPHRTALAAIGASLVPLLVWWLWGRSDRAVYPVGRWVLDLAVLLSPVVVALAVVMRPIHRPSWPRWVERAVVAFAAAAALVGPMLQPAHQDHPASLGGTGDALLPAAAVCMTLGTLLGVPLLLWLVSLRRQAERWSRPAWGVAAGAGAAGGLSIFLHCPIVAPEHLLLGHATVLLPFALLAWIGLRR